MNILFTCAGRRNYLLEYFRAIKDVKTIACDASMYAPALYLAHDYFIVPEVYDSNYVEILLTEARTREVNAIIPLNDLELPILASNKTKFEKEGIKVIVSDKEIIDICFDKYKTAIFSEDLPVRRIPTFLNIEDAIEYQQINPNCEFIIKPRWGTASIGITYPKDTDELIYQYNLTKKKIMNSFLNEISSTDYKRSVVIQQAIKGQEYGIDVINDLNSEYKATLIRKKISMRAGETDKAETLYDREINNLGEQIGRNLKHIGILDCDIFVSNGTISLVEMNPRFGGGYPFSHVAGANFPKALVEWLKGNDTPPNCFDYKTNFKSAKADRIIEMNTKNNVYIIGAGGLGREIESWISKSDSFKEDFLLKGFLDDNLNALNGIESDFKIIGKIDEFQFDQKDFAILGIANPFIKRDICERLKNKVRFLTFISDQAIIGKFVIIGEGSVIAPNCIISNNIKVGDYVTINVGTAVGHDSTLSDFSSVMANVVISGSVKINEFTFIGSNTTILPNKTICNNSKICAGSVVISDIPAHSFAYGNPARVVIKEN